MPTIGVHPGARTTAGLLSRPVPRPVGRRPFVLLCVRRRRFSRLPGRNGTLRRGIGSVRRERLFGRRTGGRQLGIDRSRRRSRSLLAENSFRWTTRSRPSSAARRQDDRRIGPFDGLRRIVSLFFHFVGRGQPNRASAAYGVSSVEASSSLVGRRVTTKEYIGASFTDQGVTGVHGEGVTGVHSADLMERLRKKTKREEMEKRPDNN